MFCWNGISPNVLNSVTVDVISIDGTDMVNAQAGQANLTGGLKTITSGITA